MKHSPKGADRVKERLIVIGSGPAGLTAAIYGARANLVPLVIEGFQAGGSPGGQLTTTGKVENFPGFPDGIGGQELMSNVRLQAERLGARYVSEDVESVNLATSPFSVKTMSGTELFAESLIIASGATARRLPLDSERRLWGRGVSACAVCDGALPLFRNKPLAVIGGGDSALEEALHLTQFGSKVYIVHRRNELRASRVLQSRAMDNPKIEVVWNKVVDSFLGEQALSGLRVKDTNTGDVVELAVAGAFEAIGHRPNTGFLHGQLKTDREGYVVTAPGRTATSVDGVFAAGDIQDPHYRQAATAVGSGCMAAIECEQWLLNAEHTRGGSTR